MRLNYLRFWYLLAVAAMLFHAAPLSAQDEPEYSLSIEEYLKSALPPQEGRMINFNNVTGILTVTDTPSNQRLIGKLVQQFDVGPKQVIIEAKFVEIEFTDLDELGIEWYFRNAKGDININESSNTFTFDGHNIANPNFQGVQWDVSASDTFPLADFGIGVLMSQLGGRSRDFITAYIKALASEGRANLLSSPKITTLSGQQANIQVTQTIPYVSNVDFENSGTAEHPIWQFEYTVEERITGITLEVTPYVSGSSDIITIDIHPEVSNLIARRPIFTGDTNNPFTSEADVPALLGWPVVDTRTAQTSVMIGSGETVVMGGFIKDDETITKKKVPIVGDIPLIGNLFRYEQKTRTKKNLVIFLTATLITAEGEAAR